MGDVLTIKDITDRSKKIFEQTDFVKRAYLFGSYARGNQTEKSDIDFMIELSRGVGLDFFGLYDLLETEFSKKVDIITKEEALRIMREHIEKEKVLIYECADDGDV